MRSDRGETTDLVTYYEHTFANQKKIMVGEKKKRNSVNKEENEKKMGQNYSSDRTLKKK